MKALYKGTIIAESDNTIVIEGNHYFPPESINRDAVTESQTRTTCPWKGEANYYNVVVSEVTLKDGAWYYPNPKPEAMEIKNYVAFWKGVEVV